jgi:hypothetical protein
MIGQFKLPEERAEKYGKRSPILKGESPKIKEYGEVPNKQAA